MFGSIRVKDASVTLDYRVRTGLLSTSRSSHECQDIDGNEMQRQKSMQCDFEKLPILCKKEVFLDAFVKILMLICTIQVSSIAACLSHCKS